MRLEEAVSVLDGWADRRVKRPVARCFVGLGVSATALNLVGLVGCLAAAFLAASGHLVAAGIVFFVASGLDAFDGSVARLTGRDREFALGGWLDAYLGSLGEAAVLLSLVLVSDDVTHGRLVALAVAVTFAVSHAKAVAGEYRIEPDWREARLVGRGIRITWLAAGMVIAGAAGRAELAVLDITLVSLTAFNVVVLAHRVTKITRRARVMDGASGDAPENG